MNTRLQGKLLEELYNLIPESSQLWIATHSIGMLRKAKELYDADNGKVVFLDFGGRNFDAPVTMRPVPPTRKFWEDVLSVALDDLATLVVPSKIFCVKEILLRMFKEKTPNSTRSVTILFLATRILTSNLFRLETRILLRSTGSASRRHCRGLQAV